MKCDAAAFAGMYETIYKDLYRYALCMMRNSHDAEDVVSETVIKGYERIHTLRSEDAFKSWMFTILSNVCKRKWKAMAKQSPVENENVWEQLSDEAAGEDTMNLRLDLRRALAVLSRGGTDDHRSVGVWWISESGDQQDSPYKRWDSTF